MAKQLEKEATLAKAKVRKNPADVNKPLALTAVLGVRGRIN